MGRKSTAQGERDGFYWLGRCYEDGSGCEQDAERGKANILIAAELGHVNAMICLGELFDKDDPQRFVWFGRAAADGI
jgi:TPR repeat protein